MTIEGTVNKTGTRHPARRGDLDLEHGTLGSTYRRPSHARRGWRLGDGACHGLKKSWAPFTTPAYAAFEDLALGGISTAAESRFPGIASQAIFLTFRTLVALLLAYRSGFIRASEKFKLGVFRRDHRHRPCLSGRVRHELLRCRQERE
jgi:Bax inhibitor 1 like protein